MRFALVLCSVIGVGACAGRSVGGQQVALGPPCYQVGSRRGIDATDGLSSAIAASQAGDYTNAVIAFEGALQTNYLADELDLGEISVLEAGLAWHLEKLESRERAQSCRILAAAHLSIASARKPGLNAPDAMGWGVVSWVGK